LTHVKRLARPFRTPAIVEPMCATVLARGIRDQRSSTMGDDATMSHRASRPGHHEVLAHIEAPPQSVGNARCR
jgi:hypothetical protein